MLKLALNADIEVLEWNRERDQLAFDPALEIKMLSSEAQEFYTAPDLLHRLLEFADFLFVMSGTASKFFAQRITTVSTFELQLEGYEKLDRWMVNQKNRMIGLLKAEWAAHDMDTPLDLLVKLAMGAVIMANKAKPKTKDEDGKVIKGEAYVPADTLFKGALASRNILLP